MAIPALIAASSTSVGRINLCLIAVDFSDVCFAQADDPQRVAPNDEYDAMEAPTDRAIADLARFAVIGVCTRKQAVKAFRRLAREAREARFRHPGRTLRDRGRATSLAGEWTRPPRSAIILQAGVE